MMKAPLTGTVLILLWGWAGAVSGFALASERIVIQGQPYLVEEGNLLELDETTGARRFVLELYDPEAMANAYELRGQTRYRVVDGESWPVIRTFSEGFEGASDVLELMGVQRGWTSLTLQSPDAPGIADYVELRKNIFARQSGFLDNRVEPSSLRAYKGEQSLRALAVPPGSKMALTKASLDTGLVYFTNGDDFWFSGWFFIESGTPTSLLDLESSFITSSPGMRLMVSPDMVPRLELKWADKPTYRLNMDRPVRLPVQKWFNLKIHFYLSSQEDGQAQLWLDDELVISGTGPTLPLTDTVLDRLQLGVTANPPGSTSIVYIDEVKVSDNSI